MSDSITLLAQGISKAYVSGSSPLPVIRSLDFELAQGKLTAIVGTSGSGKSTLLQILGGLRTPDEGEVRLLGQSFSSLGDRERTLMRRANIGFLYQFHYLLRNLSALENIALPLRLAGVAADEGLHRAAGLLEQVGLAQRADALPGQLSGGERQRVALARALVHQPRCLLLDEPTGNLDHALAMDIRDLLCTLCRQSKLACVVVTHDLDFAAGMDVTLKLERGQLGRQ